jgi:hypothetical protein
MVCQCHDSFLEIEKSLLSSDGNQLKKSRNDPAIPNEKLIFFAAARDGHILSRTDRDSVTELERSRSSPDGAKVT